jgi:prefoldin alpha subunit
VNNVEEDNAREMQSLQVYLNEYGQQADILSRQLDFMERQRIESLAAIETLKGLLSQKDSVVLVPVGGGTTVRAKIMDADNILVNIGADVVIRRTNQEAIGYLEDHVKELEAVEKKIAESLEQIKGQINELARRIEKGYQNSKAA